MRGFLIKLVVGIAGLVILVEFGSIDFAVLQKAADHPGSLALAFLCILATVPIAALRWWMLLKGLQFGLSLPWAFNTTLTSLFFHTFLPGAYGGDLVRLALAYRATGGSLNRLTFSVIVDRLMGLIALLLLGLAVLPALPLTYASRLGWVAFFAAAAGFACLAAALTTGDLAARLAERLPRPVGSKLAHVIRELLAALRAYMARPSLLITGIVISVAQYVMVLAALYLLGTIMQFNQLSWTGYVIASIGALVANSLPITPGGLGVGEAAFDHFARVLATSSVGDAGFGTVFLAMRMLTITIGVIGVLPWVFHRIELKSGMASVKAEESGGERVGTAGK